METRLIKLKRDFSNVITISNSVKNVFDILQIRIHKLKIFYSEFIKTNKQNIFIFGLDSFHFQGKLIDIEYEDMQRLFLAINNRMYCEYFKLYKIIVEYIAKNIQDKKLVELTRLNNYPVYKDLEPFREYSFETIQEIHENILNLISALMSVLSNKELELNAYRSKQDIGLNIDNFVTSFNFNNIVLREEIISFLTFVEFFHKLHTKYLKRFSHKIQLMYVHISTDIKFDDTVSAKKEEDKPVVPPSPVDSESDNEILNIIVNNDSSTCSKSSGGFNRRPKISKMIKSGVNSMVSMFRKSSSASKLDEEDTPAAFSPAEINSIFSDINMSCDNIIMSKNEVGINIDDVTSVESNTSNISTDDEAANNIPQIAPFANIYDRNKLELVVEEPEPTIIEEDPEPTAEKPEPAIIEEPEPTIIEEPEPTIIEEPEPIEEPTAEPTIEESEPTIEESEPTIEETEPVEEPTIEETEPTIEEPPPMKKKRSYKPRTKK